ncbi:hypothetical protein EWM64_g10269 [Hericium alpestre]|uniref:Uncharacterized protein n=1 Tax=Hericium alpestre TaxID=135208 RepID=A0A4Y9ZH46_9AGAM|nr:hypothetical protein EWM64_g10269 [Hericium alpestre]
MSSIRVRHRFVNLAVPLAASPPLLLLHPHCTSDGKSRHTPNPLAAVLSPFLSAHSHFREISTSHVHELGTTLTHAWDLPSLFIKETPDVHPDKLRLHRVKEVMERMSHAMNECQHRHEI